MQNEISTIKKHKFKKNDLIFVCKCQTTPILFIGEGHQQRHHSSKAPISNPLPIIIASPFFMPNASSKKYMSWSSKLFQTRNQKRKEKKRKKRRKNIFKIIIMEKRRYKKERKATSKHMKKTKVSMHDNGYFGDDNISHVIC